MMKNNNEYHSLLAFLFSESLFITLSVFKGHFSTFFFATKKSYGHAESAIMKCETNCKIFKIV